MSDWEYPIVIDYERYTHFREEEPGGSIRLFNVVKCVKCGRACEARDYVVTYGKGPYDLQEEHDLMWFKGDDLPLARGAEGMPTCGTCGGEEEE